MGQCRSSPVVGEVRIPSALECSVQLPRQKFKMCAKRFKEGEQTNYLGCVNLYNSYYCSKRWNKANRDAITTW